MAKRRPDGKATKSSEKKSKQRQEALASAQRSTGKSVRALERRLEHLEREHRALGKRLKKLTRRLDASTGGRRPDPRGPVGPWGGPWAKGVGPAVSLEVPLETDDPGAPLWATVNARLPEEIIAVADDGRVVRYRYSAVGSTPQAPRYRQIRDASASFSGGSGPFPA